MTDPMREAFEAWFNQKMGSGLLGKLAGGEYSWPDTQLTWDSWQAATKAERERLSGDSSKCT